MSEKVGKVDQIKQTSLDGPQIERRGSVLSVYLPGKPILSRERRQLLLRMGEQSRLNSSGSKAIRERPARATLVTPAGNLKFCLLYVP